MAKKNENYPPYKADQVQKVRYQASDTFTNSPKDAKKKGYLPDKTEGQYRSNLKRSRRMYNYLREKANLDTVTDDFDE